MAEDSYADTAEPPLVLPGFGRIKAGRVLVQGEPFAVIRDKYPVSPRHARIIARRPVSRFHELTVAEEARLLTWVDWVQRELPSTLSPPPDGFNLGVQDGPAAGQSDHSPIPFPRYPPPSGRCRGPSRRIALGDFAEGALLVMQDSPARRDVDSKLSNRAGTSKLHPQSRDEIADLH